MDTNIYALCYLIASVFFIFGLKGLSSPATARRGNTSGIIGMAIAVVVAVIYVIDVHGIGNIAWILLGLGVGAAIGLPVAFKIKMTDMPQLVAILHSFVGLSAVLVDTGHYLEHAHEASRVLATEVFIGAFIGAITFTGSVVAFAKLQGLVGSAPVVFSGQHFLNLAMALAMLAFGVVFVVTGNVLHLLILIVIALILGVTLIIPIGGADMPVIVSMLNSYSGWAAAATGFTLNNSLLIITGALVGSSGAILSYIMCRAMNRSFISVVLGGFGTGDEGGSAASAEGKSAKAGAVEDAAYMMKNAGKVIVVPGYGMAVAQAQHAVKEIFNTLEEARVECLFAIHPVAGRMPGHMNVLLAEADVPYDKVFELEEINNEFSTADVVLVIGANDIINPAAKTDKSSPIYGMPILECYKSRLIYVIKRSMRSGYAGVENELYYADNCMMLFGDAKAVCEKIGAAIKEA